MKPGINTEALEKFLEENFQRSKEVQNFVFEKALEGFTLLYEKAEKRVLAEEARKYKVSDELLDKLAQGNPEPLRQALLNDRPDKLDFTARFASYTQPIFYQSFVSALEGTSVKQLVLNGANLNNGNCARALFSGLPQTNVKELYLIKTDLREDSADFLVEIIPRSALITVYAWDNPIAPFKLNVIEAFAIFNKSRSTFIEMLDDLKLASDKTLIKAMQDNDCFHVFQTIPERINHFRQYVDLLALDKMRVEEQQEHIVNRVRKLSL